MAVGDAEGLHWCLCISCVCLSGVSLQCLHTQKSTHPLKCRLYIGGRWILRADVWPSSYRNVLPSLTNIKLTGPFSLCWTAERMNDQGEVGSILSIPDVRLNRNLLTNAKSFYIIFPWHLFLSNHYGAESFFWPQTWKEINQRKLAQRKLTLTPAVTWRRSSCCFHCVLLFVHKCRQGLVSLVSPMGLKAGDWQQHRTWKTL